MNHRRYATRLARLERDRGGQEPTIILVCIGDDLPSMGYRYWPDGRGEALTAAELAEHGRARPGQEIALGWGDRGEPPRLFVDA